MNISVILAHPNRQSFNHSIARTTVARLQQNEHEVWFHDLYAEQFDPILPYSEFPKEAQLPDVVKLHCREIAAADGIVIVHPNWWGQPPAILKGWIDRVLRPGVAYHFLEGDSGGGVPEGLLKAKTAMVFNTANTPHQRENQVFGDPLELLWKNCIFSLCGVENVYRRTFTTVVTSTEDQRNKWLQEVHHAINQHFPSSSPQSYSYSNLQSK